MHWIRSPDQSEAQLSSQAPGSARWHLRTASLLGGVEDQQYSHYWGTSAPRLADIDGDGRLDIITKGGAFGGSPDGLSVMRNTSTESELSFDYEFEDYYQYQYQSNNSPLLVRISDLDGNGRSDTVTTDWLGGLSVWMNDTNPGTIALQRQLTIGVGSFPASLVMCDLNQDATPEMIVGHFSSTDGLRVLHNFLPVNACVDPADFNHDAQIDGTDLTVLLGDWGGGSADLDGDNLVTGADLTELRGRWGACD